MLTLRVTLPLLLLALGCAEMAAPVHDLPPLGGPCNVASGACQLPWPSSAFEVVDTTSPTGVRLDLSDEADFATFWSHLEDEGIDGASSATTILTWSRQGLGGGLPPSAEHSVDAAASIQLVQLPVSEGGAWERIAFQSEQIPSSNGSALLALTPLRPLTPSAHFAVFVTDRVHDAQGNALTAESTFEPLLRHSREDNVDEGAWTHTQALLAFADEQLGLDRESIVQCWDFRTRSIEPVVADLRGMVEQQGARLAAAEPRATIVADEVSDGLRRIDLRFPVPVWRVGPHGPLLRDELGAPRWETEVEIRGIVLVPDTATAVDPAQLVIFGHGLGADASLMVPTIRSFDLHSGPYAVALIDWDLHGDRGRGLQDILTITTDLEMRTFADALLQSLADVPVLEHEVRALGLPITAAPPLYLGQSLGAFLGVPLAAAYGDLSGVALNVGGGGLGTVLRLGTVIETIGLRAGIEDLAAADPAEDLPEDLAYTTLLVMSQLGLDPADPLSYAAFATGEGLVQRSGQPPPILLQESLGDGIVPNLATDSLARALGLPFALPSPREVPGLSSFSSPSCGEFPSALTVWDYSEVPFEAHLLLEDDGARTQIERWFASVVDGSPSIVFEGQSCGN